MKLLLRVCALALLALCCLAPGAQAKPAKTYTFVLALKRDQGALDRLALRVSAPASGRRGAYVPLGQIERRFGASRDHRRAVTRFLRSHAARGRVRGLGSMVVARVPAGVAGRLFGQGRRIPPPLRGKVTGVAPISVSGGSASGPPRVAQAEVPKRSGTPSGCAEGLAAGGFTPPVRQGLRARGAAPGRPERSRNAHRLIVIDGFRRSDIAVYARCFGLPTPAMKVFPAGIARPLPPGDETTLDLEVLAGVAPRARRARFDVYEGGSSEAQLALTFAAPLDAPARRRPQVISASLGCCELGLKRQDVAVGVLEYLYAAAAAGGISVLSGRRRPRLVELRRGRHQPPQPNYPSTSPWITSVGGTEFTLDARIAWSPRPSGTTFPSVRPRRAAAGRAQSSGARSGSALPECRVG